MIITDVQTYELLTIAHLVWQLNNVILAYVKNLELLQLIDISSNGTKPILRERQFLQINKFKELHRQRSDLILVKLQSLQTLELLNLWRDALYLVVS